MGVIGRQFGRPAGLIGALAGRFMARNNADVNRWVVAEVTRDPTLRRIVEIGSGPGIGTQELLAATTAHVIAIDPSTSMQRQLRRRNRAAVADSRLRTITGSLADATDLYDLDLVVAVHVIYFWTDPVLEFTRIRSMLRDGGTVALGYQWRRHMPAVAQRDFPASGHRLYEDDDAVQEVVSAAGLVPQRAAVLGTVEQPAGRLLIARRIGAS